MTISGTQWARIFIFFETDGVFCYRTELLSIEYFNAKKCLFPQCVMCNNTHFAPGIPSSIPLYLMSLLVTLQLCLSSAVSHSALFQHIEDLLRISRGKHFFILLGNVTKYYLLLIININAELLFQTSASNAV